MLDTQETAEGVLRLPLAIETKAEIMSILSKLNELGLDFEYKPKVIFGNQVILIRSPIESLITYPGSEGWHSIKIFVTIKAFCSKISDI